MSEVNRRTNNNGQAGGRTDERLPIILGLNAIAMDVIVFMHHHIVTANSKRYMFSATRISIFTCRLPPCSLSCASQSWKTWQPTTAVYTAASSLLYRRAVIHTQMIPTPRVWSRYQELRVSKSSLTSSVPQREGKQNLQGTLSSFSLLQTNSNAELQKSICT